MDAIVLDGEQRSALAVTRSLGKKGVHVVVGAERLPCLASCSRYCGESFSYPSPYGNPAGFLRALGNFAEGHRESVLFPMTDVTMTEISKNGAELPGSWTLPFPEYETYAEVTDKTRLFRLARELNVPIPTTYLSTEFETREELIEAAVKAGFPVVVKPARSKIRTPTGWIDARVRYAGNDRELREILSEDRFARYPFLLQQRVEGPGTGVFLLMENGRVVARFAHRRVREKPPSGGVSVLCESIDPPADALDSAIRILAKVRWTGIAMVEFKIDREGNIARLLEVNARFWGSLQLAIAAGVDFPYLLFRMARGEKLEGPVGYRIGLRSRWELGDLDHLLLRLLKNPTALNLPSGIPSRSMLVKEFLFDFFRPSVRNEVLQAGDPSPFLHEMKGYVGSLLH